MDGIFILSFTESDVSLVQDDDWSKVIDQVESQQGQLAQMGSDVLAK